MIRKAFELTCDNSKCNKTIMYQEELTEWSPLGMEKGDQSFFSVVKENLHGMAVDQDWWVVTREQLMQRGENLYFCTERCVIAGFREMIKPPPSK